MHKSGFQTWTWTEPLTPGSSSLSVLRVAEVSDPGPENHVGDGAAGPALHGVFGGVLQHGAAHPPHPLHPVDGQLRAEPGSPVLLRTGTIWTSVGSWQRTNSWCVRIYLLHRLTPLFIHDCWPTDQRSTSSRSIRVRVSFTQVVVCLFVFILAWFQPATFYMFYTEVLHFLKEHHHLKTNVHENVVQSKVPWKWPIRRECFREEGLKELNKSVLFWRSQRSYKMRCRRRIKRSIWECCMCNVVRSAEVLNVWGAEVPGAPVWGRTCSLLVWYELPEGDGWTFPQENFGVWWTFLQETFIRWILVFVSELLPAEAPVWMFLCLFLCVQIGFHGYVLFLCK